MKRLAFLDCSVRWNYCMKQLATLDCQHSPAVVQSWVATSCRSHSQWSNWPGPGPTDLTSTNTDMVYISVIKRQCSNGSSLNDHMTGDPGKKLRAFEGHYDTLTKVNGSWPKEDNKKSSVEATSRCIHGWGKALIWQSETVSIAN